MIPTPAPGKTYAPNMVPFPTFAPGNLIILQKLNINWKSVYYVIVPKHK